MTKSNLIQLFSPTLRHETVHKTLGEEFQLCDNGSMIFHWADFHETCDYVRERMAKDEDLQKDFEKLDSNLQRLAQIPVWIKTPAKVYQTTMHALYERHILRRSHHMDGLDFFGPMDVSLISGTGPFKSMAVSEFFHKETYQQFILVSLLKGELPKRDYRIRLKAKILMEYGENFENASLIQLEQLTSKGILLNLDADLYLKEVSKSQGLRLMIDTSILREGVGMSFSELQVHLSAHVFNLMYSSRKEDAMHVEIKDVYASSSFQFLKNHQKYLFIPYEALSTSNPECIKAIQDFVNHTKELIRSYYADSEVKAA